MTSRDWPAPAKLNLFLQVTGRRPDGFHELQTVFQIIDLCDSLDFEVRDDGLVKRVAGSAAVAPEEDLVVRAARLLQRRGAVEHGVRIAVRKRIPLQGGLGGGSSDAATTLVALNELWGTGLGIDELAALGLQLGADVPVFVRGHSAWGEGVGEELVPIDLPQRWFAVIRPPVAVSTAEVFQAPDLTRNSPKITIRGFLQAGGRNDCEPVVTARYPEVRQALDWLGQFGEARMTGTGSCVFASFVAQDEAARALRGMAGDWQGFVARGLAVSPLPGRLEAERTARQADLG
ncbi:MAG TPA: 4-(cytidine 5'-diphospho)-2-C-methyl-D-erythritol kinase [Steroidobacteraceae bacterium]|nr:4-(cytidine 5'-diphospho)-2-C-methyl-D-erythritol kinase [Steroidobacteraceae bacterium]